MSRRQLLGHVAALAWLTLAQISVASAEPYVPSDDRHVLERLSLRATDPVARGVRAIRARLLKNPRDLDTAAELATRYIELGRREGDPRFLGHAQAVLAPWWSEPTPPPTVLLLRATIRQNMHEFNPALADLDALLAVQPANIQAWLTRATILQVQARYEDARRSCQPLMRLAARHIALTCLGDVAGMTGQAAKSREVLAANLSHPELSDRERLWILTILAELATRVGDVPGAERYFTGGIRLSEKNYYLIGAYADFLLDQGRAHEVIQLLGNETRSDGLLLRLALAEQALDLPVALEHRTMLAARFAAGRERGTRIHLREEARFTLALLHDSQTALKLAEANWHVQRETWDARILLESALAARNPTSAQPVLDWLRVNHVEDRHLQQLAVQLSRVTP